MTGPEGFTFGVRNDTEVVIAHRGRKATTLRGTSARDFLDEVGDDQHGRPAQELMARVTGNYKHGNERLARSHPRNRERGSR